MATESSQMFLLLAVLVLGIFADPSESQELRCQCIQTQSDFISPKFIAKVQIIPEGAHCNRKEIMCSLHILDIKPSSNLWIEKLIFQFVVHVFNLSVVSFQLV
ncbi:C-X-C motif chemokine 15-like isoform X1 [Bos indicus]|uniref:C-X-C motif chemokine 15-like isoform X1 n=1 Tax=Bos indicus TaxID=9915 RepID=A0A6P5BYS8_BOSIN|nr:PREDICTED: C-X-C motif chemokine 15-like isoform X1 [Bos indicus]